MLRLGDHACCQLLCNVRAELSRSIPDQCRLTKDGRAPPYQGRPREKREGGEQSSTEMSSGKSHGVDAGRARGRKPHNWITRWRGMPGQTRESEREGAEREKREGGEQSS